LGFGIYSAAVLGCSGRQTVPPAADAVAQAPAAAGSSWQPSPKAPAPTPPPPPATTARTSLKPSTYVSLGALKEQAADDPDRPLPEREAFRYQARQSYLKAIDLDKKYTPAYVALAKSYFATDERDKAQATFKKALALAPKDGSIWFEQGAALARAKDWDAAVESMMQATRLDPENKQYQKYLGLTLARAGRYDEGYYALARCMPEAEARTIVARMLRHNQDPAAAEQQLRLALAADPTYEPARGLLAGGGPAAESPVRTVSYEEPAGAGGGGK
jgi:tetratricopeptide (TPR) repeat protein